MRKIIADSSADRPTLAGVEVIHVPLVMSTEEKNFCDDANLDITEMLDYLAVHKGRSFTACPSVDSWLSAYEGANEIFAVTITSGLSGSYNSAMAARELYLSAHEDAKVHVFDSLSTGPENLLILEKIAELSQAGKSFEEIVAEVTAYQKHTRLFFALQSLHNLSQNGRVSKVAAAAVGVLGIRIVGTASPEGTLAQLAKSRGDNKALKELIAQLTGAGFVGGKVRIAHVENPTLAQRMADEIQKVWANASIAIGASSGLCSYYAERGAILVGIEVK